jgi:putative RNA 2'-phosphotransferase
LFHGTATRFLDSIREKGILKMSRNYVQLSEKIDTAMEVGGRHGKPVVLGVDTKTMREDGIKFYLSNNNVWLTEFVDSKYILAILGDNKK